MELFSTASFFFFEWYTWKGMRSMQYFTLTKEYKSTLSLYETQTAIGMLKRCFEDYLSQRLNLKRVSAPLFVDPKTGLNDDLNGTEHPVEFEVAETGEMAQVVHSLAKWKRMALYQYGFPVGEGIYTNMNAIRKEEEMDRLHSIYVDQWDWEKIIGEQERKIEYLKRTVQEIVNSICDTKDFLMQTYPQLTKNLSRNISFITTQELEDQYPMQTPKERENLYLKEHKSAFIMQIGDVLKSGLKHDGRAPDYDDWTLNGDIVFWNDILECAFEVSSMGIRVDEKAMSEQLEKAGCNDRKSLPFHRMLLNGELPLTIGGGIGQSRLSMLLLEKAHIGEVQVSIWNKETLQHCKKENIPLL